MKLTVERNALHAALGRISKAVENRNTIPILSNVLLESRDNGTLTLSATDLDLYAKVTIAAEVEVAGSLTVPAMLLAGMAAKMLAGSKAALEQIEASGLLRVKSGRLKVDLHYLPATDFPAFDTPKDAALFSVDAKALHGLLAKTEGCISTEETRYYLNGVFLHAADGKLRGVSTDGHKLACSDIDMPEGAEGIPGVIVPKKAVAIIKALAEKSTGGIAVAVASNKIQFTFADGVTLSSKVIDGTFPDYTRVIPKENDKIVRVDRAALSQAVDRVSTIAVSKGKAVNLTIHRDLIELAVKDEGGLASDDIEASYEGEPITIAFNAGYLASHLSVLSADVITLKMKDAGSPAILMDEEGADLMLILMPLRGTI